MSENDKADEANELLFFKSKSISSAGEKKRKGDDVEGIINVPNPHVIIQEVLNMQCMFEHVVTLVSCVSKELKLRNEKGFRIEHRDLKRIIDVLKCMEKYSQEGLSVLTSSSARLAHQRKRKEFYRSENRSYRDPVDFSRAMCNLYIGKSSDGSTPMWCTSTKWKCSEAGKNKFKFGKESECPNGHMIEYGKDFKLFLPHGEVILMPQPSKGKLYKPYEIWTHISEKVPANKTTACLKILIREMLIPCQLRNAQYRLKDFQSGNPIRYVCLFTCNVI